MARRCATANLHPSWILVRSEACAGFMRRRSPLWAIAVPNLRIYFSPPFDL